MQLLALKKRLEQGIDDPEEEKEVRSMIQKLEEKLELA